MKDKESTIIYQKQVDICKRHLLPEQFGRLMYALFEDNPEVDEDIAIAYEFMKLQKNVNDTKYEQKCERNRINGMKGGRPKAENPKNRTVISETERLSEKPNGFFQNPNDNDKIRQDIENGIGELQESVPDEYNVPLSLISYLNQKTGSSYKVDSDITSRIISLFGQGYSVDDMRTVIDRKCAEWCDDEKMRSYLRPSTLFGDKFAEYLNAPEPIEVERQKGAAAKQEQLLKSLSDKENELEQLSERIDEIRRGGEGSVKDHFDELNDLKLKQAIAEQDIESLKRRTGAVGT